MLIFFAALRAAVRIRHRRTATGEEHLQSVNMVSIVAELDGCWAAASAGPLPTALHAAAAWQRRQAGCGGGWRLDGAERLLVPCAEMWRPLLSGREPRVWPACFARLWSCSAARRRLRLSPVPALSTGLIVVVWDSLARARGLTGRRCPDQKMNVQWQSIRYTDHVHASSIARRAHGRACACTRMKRLYREPISL